MASWLVGRLAQTEQIQKRTDSSRYLRPTSWAPKLIGTRLSCPRTGLGAWLATVDDWLVGSLATVDGWLDAWLAAAWLPGELPGSRNGWPAGWLADWLAGWLAVGLLAG